MSYSFSLATFVKICLLDSSKQVAEVQKKVTSSSGGYDFYRSLFIAIRAKIDQKSEDEITDILMSPSNAVEREFNKYSYEVFTSKYGKSKSLVKIDRPRIFSPKDANFSIRVSPVFSLEVKGLLKVYSYWSMQQPELTQSGGAIACYVMREAYKSTTLANAQFCYADLVNKKQYSEKQVKNSTSTTFNSVVGTVSRLITKF